MLATDFANYEKGLWYNGGLTITTDLGQGEMFHDYTDSLFGTGVFNADGEEGVHQLSES